MGERSKIVKIAKSIVKQVKLDTLVSNKSLQRGHPSFNRWTLSLRRLLCNLQTKLSELCTFFFTIFASFCLPKFDTYD